jgi:sulfur carrier protein
MTIHINGKAYSLGNETHISISSALSLHFSEPQQSTFAVALNGDFVGKTEYETVMVKHGDSVDILQPIQGG